MSDILYFRNQREFIEWLEVNHQTTTEIWLGFFKKKANKEGFTWSESVDCALMFGWIDGIRKTVDEDSYKIRFTPRKLNSVWSKVNVQKVEKLIELDKMKPEGLTVFNQRKDQTGYSAVSRNVELSKKNEELIRQNSSAWEFFNQLPASYKRDSIWWVMSAKKEETQLRRLNRLIEAWEKGDMLRP
ncbi:MULTISPECIES: YdeI/OmpD-associated family protein [Vagococcus]|uniref:Gll0036 protein n=1 Tax=Vagococcus fluvialis bH819 TaxID=1255619 RepID=A0A1X6WPE9_9ENTE|nr:MULTISPECIES: YdeI/OmpD-associated family protein [Vagococcus]SLM86138.1 Gll0036 protein [Vagococcus fluvialis bH819]HCM90386.1 bacteriocin-protection protein [Vagococcus sp.]